MVIWSLAFVVAVVSYLVFGAASLVFWIFVVVLLTSFTVGVIINREWFRLVLGAVAEDFRYTVRYIFHKEIFLYFFGLLVIFIGAYICFLERTFSCIMIELGIIIAYVIYKTKIKVGVYYAKSVKTGYKLQVGMGEVLFLVYYSMIVVILLLIVFRFIWISGWFFLFFVGHLLITAWYYHRNLVYPSFFLKRLKAEGYREGKELVEDILGLLDFDKPVEVLSSGGVIRDPYSFSVGDRSFIVIPKWLIGRVPSEIMRIFIIHELVHIKLDGDVMLIRYIRRNELLTIYLSLFLLFIKYTLMIVFAGLILGISDIGLLVLSFLGTTYRSLIILCIAGVFYALVQANLSLELTTIRFREARCFFVSTFLIQDPELVLKAVLFQRIGYKRVNALDLVVKDTMGEKFDLFSFVKGLHMSLLDILFNFMGRKTREDIQINAIKLAKIVLNDGLEINSSLDKVDITALGTDDYEMAERIYNALTIRGKELRAVVDRDLSKISILFNVIIKTVEKMKKDGIIMHDVLS